MLLFILVCHGIQIAGLTNSTFFGRRCFQAQLAQGDETATCPSCSLIIRVIYDYVSSVTPYTTKEGFDSGWLIGVSQFATDGL